MTLLEMLVAISILLLFAAALPGLLSDRASHRDTVSQVISLLRMARLGAITEGAPADVVIDLEDRTIKTDETEASMPPGVAIEVRSARELTLDGELRRIRFFPDGSATGGVIALSEGEQQTSIHIHWLTGSVSREE